MKLMSERMQWLEMSFALDANDRPLDKLFHPKLLSSHSHAINWSMIMKTIRQRVEVLFTLKNGQQSKVFSSNFPFVSSRGDSKLSFRALPCPCVINLSSFIREEIIIFWWLFMSQHFDRVDVGGGGGRQGKATTFPRSRSRKIFLLKCFSCFVFVAVDI